ncbi:MAG: glycosyltransferase family 2 protein [Oscillospiraceae bacterium]|nr:glycosyltransferase family 2 protein [Oscillospiraceae bacterium]
MNEPKVSIIIPVYNGSNYMRCAIDCALNQTYENKEIVVVNDGSTDEGKTEEIALSYGDRIRYFSKPNGGVSSALNYGIAKMTGEYFAWLSHDDAYTTSRIKDAVELLKAHDLLGKKFVGYTGGYIADANGIKIKDFRKCFEKNRIYSGYEVMEIMTAKGTLYGCNFLIPRSAFEEAGIFEESLRYSQDALMWYRIFLAGYGLISDELPNVMGRMHGNQVSQLRRDLFSHDALVIAKILAEPLAKADDSGALLMRYTKRLTKYQCDDALKYLCNYAGEHGYLTAKERIEIRIRKFWGLFRFGMIAVIKKALIRFRS